jgi:NAD(P)-dependent dehydrogenase (short-subunit alcohol dehydrogenase family)
LRFCQEGASVAILDRDSRRGGEVLQEIHQRDQKAIFLPVDVANEAQVREAIERTEAELGGLHILVNNAAAFVFGSHDVTEADWDKVLSVNVKGAAFCAKYAADAMVRAGGGAIVNVNSISASSRRSTACLTTPAKPLCWDSTVAWRWIWPATK